MDTALACSIAGLLFYILAVTAPFIQVQLGGRSQISMLETGPTALEAAGYWELGVVVLAFTVLMPLAKLLVMLTVLLGLRLANPPAWLHVPFRWLERLSPWAMVEVYLLGLFVAYTRLVALAHVNLEVACYALVGLMLAMISADVALDPEAAWQEMERRGIVGQPGPEAATSRPGAQPIGCHVCHRVDHAVEGEPCSRCGTTLHRRKPGSLARTAALAATALVLYVPANIYPVMNITRIGRTGPHTILGGAQELLDAGLWPLALLVFFASITVPVLKLVSLTLMVATTHSGTSWRLIDRTRLYRIVDFIGRWSMIDVFMISILVALVHFGQLADIGTDVGAVSFAAVVILTMFASQSFDPRLMWDAAEADARTPADRHELAGEAGGATT